MQARPLGFRNSHRVWVAITLATLSLGCRRDAYTDAYFDMLNAEKRVLEDRLYETEYNYEKALQELEAARGNAKGGKKPAGRTRSDESEEPLTEPRGDEPSEAPELPTIELPPGVEEGKRKKTGSAVMRPASAVVAEAAALSARSRPLSEDELAAAIVSALDQRVEMIHLNPRLTGGADFDAQPGDDGICVLVEPRNRSGDFVPEPARVSVVLLDPTKSDDAARVARWDLDAEATRQFLQTDTADRGLLLRLPWQGTPPETKRLHVFVRYMTADGRKLEADREIDLDSADRVAHRWTPRRSPSPEEAASREVTVSWQAKDQAEPPAVVQAVAETPEPQPVEPKAPSVKPAGRASTKIDGQPSATTKGRFWKPDRS
jgi:hypothetical protein